MNFFLLQIFRSNFLQMRFFFVLSISCLLHSRHQFGTNLHLQSRRAEPNSLQLQQQTKTTKKKSNITTTIHKKREKVTFCATFTGAACNLL